MARSRSLRSRQRSRSHSRGGRHSTRGRRHSSRGRSHSRTRRHSTRGHHPTKKTYHPCSSTGKCDLRHTYHSRHPQGAAEKYAKHLVKGGSKDGRIHIKEVTRGCGNDKIYCYTYRGRRLSRKEGEARAFERKGELIVPKVSVKVRRV